MTILNSQTFVGKPVTLNLNGFDESQETILQQAMDRLIPISPAWLNQLNFYQIEDEHPSDGTILMDVSVDYPYRFATINIYPRAWKPRNVERFSQHLLHEFVHIWLEPCCRFSQHLLDNCCAKNDPASEQVIRSAYQDSIESLVSDLTVLLNQVISEAPPKKMSVSEYSVIDQNHG